MSAPADEGRDEEPARDAGGGDPAKGAGEPAGEAQPGEGAASRAERPDAAPAAPAATPAGEGARKGRRLKAGLLRRTRRRVGTWIAGPEAPPPPPRTKLGRALRKTARIAGWTLLAVVLLLCAVRIALPFALPPILRFALGKVGLAASYERLDLSLLAGEVQIARLEVRPAEGGEPILSVAHVGVDVAVSRLFLGRLSVRRVSVDGLEALIERDADGDLAIAKLVKKARANRPPEPEKPHEPKPPFDPFEALEKLQRVDVEAVRVQGLHVRIRDASTQPSIDLHVYLDARLSDFDLRPTSDRATRLELLVRAPTVLPALQVTGTLRAGGASASGFLEVGLDRLDLSSLGGWLEPLGIRPAAKEISLGMSLRGRPHAGEVGPGSAPGIDLDLERLAVTADGRECAALDRAVLEVTEGSGAARALEVTRLGVYGVRARAERLDDGAVRVAGIDLVRSEPIGVDEQAEARRRAAPAAPAKPKGEGLQLPRVTIRDVAIVGVQAKFHDAFVEPPASLALAVERVQVRDLVIDPESPAAPAPVSVRITAPGLVDLITVTGTALLAGPEKVVDLRVDLDGIVPKAAAPYLAGTGIKSTLSSGRAGLHVRAQLSKAPEGGLAIDGAVTDLAFADGGNELAGIDAVRVAGRVDSRAKVLALRGVEVVRPRIHAERDAQGNTYALGVRIDAERPKPRARPRGEPRPVAPAGAAEAGLATGHASPGGLGEAPPPATPSARPQGAAAETTTAQVETGTAAPAPPVEPLFEQPAPGPAEPAWSIALGRLSVADGDLRFVDDLVGPTASANVEGLTVLVEDLATSLAPDAPTPTAAQWRVAFRAPGLADTFEAKGSLVAAPRAPSLTLRVTARGISAGTADGWLAKAGLARELTGASLDVALAASARLPHGKPLEAECIVEKVKLRDEDHDLLLVEDLRARGLRVQSGAHGLERLELEEASLKRVWTSVSFDRRGLPGGLGFRVVGNIEALARAVSETADVVTRTAAAAAQETVPEGERAAAEANRIAAEANPGGAAPGPVEAAKHGRAVFALGRLVLGEVAVDIEDRRFKSPLFVPVRISAGAGPLVFDTSGKGGPPLPGDFELRVSVPGAIDMLALTGQVSASPAEAHTHATLSASGITAGVLRPALRAAGLEPILRAGTVTAVASADAKFGGGAVDARASIEGVSFADAQTHEEWAGIDAVRVVGAHVERGVVTVDEVAILGPRAYARRDADGTLVAAGMRLVPVERIGPLVAAAPPLPAPPRVPRSTEATGPEGAAAPDAPEEVRRAAVSGPATTNLELRLIRIEGVTARFEDRARGRAAPVSVTVAAQLSSLVIGRRAPPAKLHVEVSVPGALDALTLDGGVTADPRMPLFEAVVAARGMRAGPLAPFLPPGIGIDWKDGRFGARLHAASVPQADGGHSVEVSIGEVRLGDAQVKEPFLSIDDIRLRAPRIDPEGGRVAIDEVSIEGIVSHAEKQADGSLTALGLRLGGPASTTATGAAQTGPASAAGPARPDSAQTSEGVAAAASATLTATPQPRVYPFITCETLRVNVRRFTFLDRSKPGAVPLVVKEFVLKNSNPLKALGNDPTSQPYLGFEVAGEIQPIVKLVTATARLSPFSLEPEASIRANVSGLRGAGINEALPALASVLDGSGLKDGRGHLEVVVRPSTKRRDPVDFSFLQKGFGLEATVRRTWFRDGGGPILLGIQDFRIDVARLEPATGAIRIREVELAKPTARIRKDGRGMVIGGITFIEQRAAPAATRPRNATETGEAVDAKLAEAKRTDAAAAASAGNAGADLVLERFIFSDCDILYEDVSVSPPLTIPITGIDVEAGPIGVRTAGVMQPTRIDAHLRAGDVSLPRRSAQDFIPGVGFVRGMIGTVADATGLTKKDMQMRPLFSDISAKGEIALDRRPVGALKLSVAGLELAALSGAAKKGGVDLNDGLFDLDTELQIARDGQLRFTADALFTDLDVSEDENGPIRSWLMLPAPLGVVTYSLKNEDGEILIPVRVQMGAEGLGGGALASAISRAIGQVVGTALANIGFRAVGTVTDLGKGVANIFMADSVTYTPAVIKFAPGEPVPTSVELQKANEIVAAAKGDDMIVVTVEHAIGGGDYARSRVRGNPSASDRRELLARILARKKELTGRRSDLLAEARAATVANLGNDANDAARQIQETDRELVVIESSLDKVYELERGGAERAAGRRGRMASLGLARTRLETVRDALIAAGVPDTEGRIVVARPRVEDAQGTEGGTVTISATRRRKK